MTKSGRSPQVAIGLAFWLSVPAPLAWRLDRLCPSSAAAGLSEVCRQLGTCFAGRSGYLTLACFEPLELAVCDPVFVQGRKGELRLVGLVRPLGRADVGLAQGRAYGDRVELVLLPGEPSLGWYARTLYFSWQTSLLWVAGTLLTPQRCAEIAAELQQVLDRHGEELSSAIRPLVVRTLVAAAAVSRRLCRLPFSGVGSTGLHSDNVTTADNRTGGGTAGAGRDMAYRGVPCPTASG